MAKRKSIEFKTFFHVNPIPGASMVGNILMSSVISGTNPGTKDVPDEFDQQIRNVFTHIRACVEAAGGTPDDIVKVTFWVRDPASQRVALNDEWVKMFPDADSRPARHTLPLGGSGKNQISCDFMAVLGT